MLLFSVDGVKSSAQDGDVARILSMLPHTTYVSLANTDISDEVMLYLRSMDQLQSLDLRNTAVSDAGMRNIVGIRRLQYLDISGTAITNRSVDDIGQLSSLGLIVMTDTGIDEDGIQRLLRRNPALQIQISTNVVTASSTSGSK
jgi:hypothetical protein